MTRGHASFERIRGAAAEMSTVATLILRALTGSEDAAVIEQVRNEVRELCGQFPLPH